MAKGKRKSATTKSIQVAGLTRLDAMDLQKKYPDAAITFESAKRFDAQHGELATWAIVVLTLAGIQALAAWLLMNRKNNVIEKTVEIVDADGSKRKETISIKIDERTSDATVVKELAAIFDFDLGKALEK